MAINEGLRINALTDKLTLTQLLALYSTLRLAIDDPTFTGDTPYILVEDLLKPINDTLTTHSGRISNNETSIINYESFKTLELDALVDDLGWTSGYLIASQISSGFIRCCKRGKAVAITGKVKLGSIPSENTVIFRLPPSFPLFTETHYFTSNDAALGRGDEAMELKALQGTRDIVMGRNGSNDTEQCFNETFWQ